MNSPAARLANILKRLLEANKNISTKDALAPILGSADGVEFARSFGYLIGLPQQVAAAVTNAADPDHDDVDWYLQWRPTVDRALSQAWAFTSAVHSVQQLYSSNDIIYLEACGNLLGRARIEPRIAPETLDDLWQKTQDLRDDLFNAEDLPADLKSFMLDQLEGILRAFREFIIRGPEALAEAINQAVGATVTSRIMPRIQESPEAQPWWKKFSVQIALITSLIGIPGTVLALPPAYQAAVEAISPSAEAGRPTSTIVIDQSVNIEFDQSPSEDDSAPSHP
ncbi:hypothetical protein ACH47B_26920 [Rhodococcus sp. NPDC019627]|uniref:hypothetical protein n=1 Tax=unclassified Rhodococcus (in: high G+C Gram-positive bacteria) TaxID=192944 RepID=UPI0033CBC665